MKYYTSLNEKSRIEVTTPNEEYASEDMITFDFPNDFNFSKQAEYRIVNGKLIHDPEPPTDEEIERDKKIKRRSQLETATLLFVRTNAKMLSDEEALGVSMLFEEWSEKCHYTKGDIRQHKDLIYRCLNDHDSQASWTPDQAHSLWVRIRPPGEIQDWEPVTPGINEPYSKGDKVKHKGKVWISNIDNNVWEPGTVGTETLWTEIAQ